MSSASVHGDIDWHRMAEPQADQYDSEVVLRLAASTISAGRSHPYMRTPANGDPAVFDGQVAVRPVYRSLPEFESLSARYPDAPMDHPNIGIASGYVRNWPVVFTQCQRLLEAIHPAIDPQMPIESPEIYRGSLCHSYECMFGTMWATIFCPVGLAEAIVHEMAHQKLRVLGVAFESATTIVGNDPSVLYVSPIIKDRRRPMTAVLHAQYSYVYVTALDIRMIEAERDPVRRDALGVVLGRNVARIQEGYETLQQHFEPGTHGREFMAGLSEWTEQTIAAAGGLLRQGASRGSGNGFGGVEPSHGGSATAALPGTLPRIDTRENSLLAPDRRWIEIRMTLKSPHIVLLGNVLNGEECDALIEYCEPRLEPSLVVADADGNVAVHQNRTSQSVGLRLAETALIARIEARLAALVQWPVDWSEGLQVLRYDVAAQYRAHYDWIDPTVPGLRKHLKNSGQRLATVILYLSEVEAGGATSFPSVGLEVRPQKGGAIFFVNTDAQYTPDRRTLHAGEPVVRGVKFIANKWLRERCPGDDAG